MSILEKAIDVYSSRRSPLEQLRDARRQNAKDKITLQNHQMLQQQHAQQQQAHASAEQRKQREQELLRGITQGGAVHNKEIAAKMKNAAIQIGDTDLANKWNNIGSYEEKRAETLKKQKEQATLEQMRTRVYNDPDDQEALNFLAGKAELPKSITDKEDDPLKHEKQLLDIERKKQTIANAKVDVLDRRREAQNTGIQQAVSVDAIKNKKGKVTGINASAQSRDMLQKDVAEHFEGQDVTPEEVSAWIKENYIRVEGAKDSIWGITNPLADKGPSNYVPREFASRIGDIKKASILFARIQEEEESIGKVSDELRKELAAYGIHIN